MGTNGHDLPLAELEGPARRRSWRVVAPVVLIVAVLIALGARPQARPQFEAGVLEPTEAPLESLPTVVSSTTRPPTTTTTTPAPAVTAPRRTTPTSARRAAAPTLTAPDYGPVSPGTLMFPYIAGQSSWQGKSHDVTAHLTISPAAPRAGEPITFTFDLAAPHAQCCGLNMLFGDGGSTEALASWPCPEGGPRGDGTRRYVFTHTYNRPGRADILFSAHVPTCDSPVPTQGDFRVKFDVAPAP